MCVTDPPPPGPSGLTTARSSVLPFLPTLATALAIAGLSLLCREPPGPPAHAADALALPVLAQGDRLASPASPDAGPAPSPARVPAALAFADVYPLIPVGQTPRAAVVAQGPVNQAPANLAPANLAPVHPAAGNQVPVAQATLRRGCPQHCADTRRAAGPRAAPSVSEARFDAPSAQAKADPVAADQDAWLPEAALPFVPDSQAAWDGVRALGSRAATLGSAVADAIPAIR